MASALYSLVAWIAGNRASHIHFLRIARADIHPFLVISMAISLWLCPLFMIWYVYEAGFKPAIVLLCCLALRLPLIALERLALQGSEWRISIGGIVAVPVLLACLVLLILRDPDPVIAANTLGLAAASRGAAPQQRKTEMRIAAFTLWRGTGPDLECRRYSSLNEGSSKIADVSRDWRARREYNGRQRMS